MSSDAMQISSALIGRGDDRLRWHARWHITRRGISCPWNLDPIDALKFSFYCREYSDLPLNASRVS